MSQWNKMEVYCRVCKKPLPDPNDKMCSDCRGKVSRPIANLKLSESAFYKLMSHVGHSVRLGVIPDGISLECATCEDKDKNFFLLDFSEEGGESKDSSPFNP